MIFILVAIFWGGLVSANPTIPKIIGGQPIEIENAPYQISFEVLRGISYSFTCGGVIIGPNYFLTAGHCVNPAASPSNYRARVGSEIIDGGEIYRVASITRHPQYIEIDNPLGHADYDIAFVVTREPFVFSDTVKPIVLAQNEPQPDAPVQVTGWGLTSPGGRVSENLQQLNLTVVDRESCEEEFNSPNIEITPTIICAKPVEDGTDPCNGDSGGPVVGNGELIGLVSFGGPCELVPHNVVAYTNVASFNDWVSDQIAKIS